MASRGELTADGAVGGIHVADPGVRADVDELANCGGAARADRLRDRLHTGDRFGSVRLRPVAAEAGRLGRDDGAPDDRETDAAIGEPAPVRGVGLARDALARKASRMRRRRDSVPKAQLSEIERPREALADFLIGHDGPFQRARRDSAPEAVRQLRRCRPRTQRPVPDRPYRRALWSAIQNNANRGGAAERSAISIADIEGRSLTPNVLRGRLRRIMARVHTNKPAAEYDVVVLGSGAAGLCAAVAAAAHGASVGVFEKAHDVGGSTALSLGIGWFPVHPHSSHLTRADALAYLDALSNDLIRPEIAEAFVDSCCETIDFIESTTPIRYRVISGFPDYHPEKPGGMPSGGRTVGPEPVGLDELGDWSEKIAHFPGHAWLARRENRSAKFTRPVAQEANGAYQARESVDRLAPVFDTRELEREKVLSVGFGGVALIGGFLTSCLELGVDVFTETPARDLLLADGEVVGVVVSNGNGKTREVRARRGVVIATGGFEWDEGLVRDFLRGPMDAPLTPPTNTGDGLKMAMKVGAALGVMREAWWNIAVQLPDETAFGRRRSRSIRVERARPGCILVNRAGKRFANEAAEYNALGAALHEMDANDFSYRNLPAWLLFDEGYFRRYGFLYMSPTSDAPGWLNPSASIAELADKIGIPAAALEETVGKWNRYVSEGRDPDFGRGDSVYDRWWGDWSCEGTHRTLGEIRAAPFYAIEVRSGTLGTHGGPKTDVNGQVLHVDGYPLPGLYVAGNAMASPTGMAYGGAGGTIGPALVWGFRAGRHAASAGSGRRSAAVDGAGVA